MSSCRRMLTIVCIFSCGSWASGLAKADTAWSVVSGDTLLLVYPDMLSNRGITLELHGQAVVGSALTKVPFSVSPDSTVTYTETNGRFETFAGGRIEHLESLTIRVNNTTAEIAGFTFNIDADINPGSFKPAFIDKVSGESLLNITDAKVGFDRLQGQFRLETSGLTISPYLASKLGDASLAGFAIGDIQMKAQVLWVGGDRPVVIDDSVPAPSDEADPRGGNNGTVCPTPVGPDVITGTLTDIGSYGSNEVPPGSGNWIAAFAVGTESCNVGNALVLWDDDAPPPTNLHPVIAQNIFRLRTMPNGSTRFEQIGQSWLKHSFTVAAGNACGCGCTGPGGPQLHPGCSDPYGSGLNGSQGSLGPRWQVNARTGEYPHPYTDGTHDTGDTTVWKRCQVNENELGMSNVSYFAEGQYVTQDDHQAGNASNNCSYSAMTISMQSAHSWSGSNSGQTTHRMVPAIRAWKAAVPSVVETDIYISPTAGEPFPNAKDYMILAANAKDIGGGLWTYDYALYNMHSHRGAMSFSVPVANSVEISDVEFHDVPFHSGDGESSITRSNANWGWTHESNKLTWSTQSYASNPNANAILWGLLFNFRFTCNIPPAGEQGDVIVGLFRPGPPNAAISSVNASTVIPEPAALYLKLDSNAPTGVLAACASSQFDVSIENGSDVFVPGTGKLHVSVDDAPYVESALELVGGTIHRASMPSVQCGSSVKFYLSAQSLNGTTVTNPEEAPAAFFLPQVGTEEVVTILRNDFESGLGAGWGKSGLWEVTSSCAVQPTCNGSTHWAYFGQPATCNYSTGAQAIGSLTKVLTIPSTRLATLHYCSTFEREQFAFIDWPTVKVNGATVDQPALGGLASSPWVQRTVDLTPYAGQTVTLEWYFNSTDPWGNEFLGWQIDDVSVDVIQVACRAHNPAVMGDVDGNDVADGLDILEFTAAALSESTLPEHVCTADFNGDGVVDVADCEGLVTALLAQP